MVGEQVNLGLESDPLIRNSHAPVVDCTCHLDRLSLQAASSHLQVQGYLQSQ